MIFQKIRERPVYVTRFPTNLRPFIKQVYQKEWLSNINKKKGQNNYFRAEISQKEQQLLRLKLKKKIDF